MDTLAIQYGIAVLADAAHLVGIDAQQETHREGHLIAGKFRVKGF